MVESIDNSKTGCYEYAVSEKDGNAMVRDVLFGRDNKIFSITVGTREALDSIKKDNEPFPEDGKLSENIFVMDDLSDMDEICRKLRLEIPFETLQPYLREQTLQEVSS